MSGLSVFAWCAVGALLVGAASWTSAIPLTMWVGLASLLHVARQSGPAAGALWVWAAIFAAFTAGYRGQIPVPGAAYVLVTALIAATCTLPFVVDRTLASRLDGWPSTLLFPLTWVVLEFVRARLTPYTSWGSAAYGEAGHLPLLQLAAFTGLWGISFLIAWFASVLEWAYARGFAWPTAGRGVLWYAVVLALVLLGGGLRLSLARPATRSIRAAAITYPKELFEPDELTQILEGRVDATERPRLGAKVARLQDWFLDATRREARAGAAVVVWAEVNLLVFAEDESAFLDRARRLAADEHVHVLMGLAVIAPGAPRPLVNKAVLVDPSGAIALTHRKGRPLPGLEASISMPGDRTLATADTAVGRVISAICFEMDFPQVLRQAGQAGSDLMLVPANDWAAIKDRHLEMATFRAVESGVPMVRAASSGTSGAVDAFGRVIARKDDFLPGARVMVAQVPLGHVRTLYTRVGDLFAWLCVGGLVGAIALAIRAR